MKFLIDVMFDLFLCTLWMMLGLSMLTSCATSPQPHASPQVIDCLYTPYFLKGETEFTQSTAKGYIRSCYSKCRFQLRFTKESGEMVREHVCLKVQG